MIRIWIRFGGRIGSRNLSVVRGSLSVAVMHRDFCNGLRPRTADSYEISVFFERVSAFYD